MKYLLVAIALILVISAASIVWFGPRFIPRALPEPVATTSTATSVSPVASAIPAGFLRFTSPIERQVVHTNSPVPIAWEFSDSNLAEEFPDFAVYLTLVLPDGGEGSLVGTSPSSPYEDAFRGLDERSLVWNPQKQIDFWSGPNTVFPYGNGFKIRAGLQYVGKAAYTCDPTVKGECSPVYPEPIQSRIQAARALSAESGTFYIIKE